VDPFKEDPDLLEGFRKGVPSALDRVYRAFAKPLRNFVVRGFSFKSGSRDLYFRGAWPDSDLDDIVQETFRRAFGERARQSFDGIRPYKNYLFTIARNAVINDLTARNRQIPVGDALLGDGYKEDMTPLEAWIQAHRCQLDPNEGCSSHDQLENLEVYGLVEAFIASLDSSAARFFQLRFLAHLSQEKTAKKMDWNRAKVRKLEAKLRTAFLSHLQGTGYLANRPELNKIRRKSNCGDPEALLDASRQIYLDGHAELCNEFLRDAA
jgi:RNA polymerase sigma factor (sigma-70 family)